MATSCQDQSVPKTSTSYSEPVSVYVHHDQDELDTTGTLFAEILSDTGSDANNIVSDLLGEIADSDDDDDFVVYLNSNKSKAYKNWPKNEWKIDHELHEFDKHDTGPSTIDKRQLSSFHNHEAGSPKVLVKPIVLDAGVMMRSAIKAKTLEEKVSKREAAIARNKERSKNALNAKRNREMKKKKFADLESRVENLEAEKEKMQRQLQEKTKLSQTLQNEIVYLRNVIANQSSLSNVLKCFKSVPGLLFVSNNSSSDTTNNNVSEGCGQKLKHNKNEPECKSNNVSLLSSGNGPYVRASGSPKRCRLDSTSSSTSILTPPATPNPEEQVAPGGICLHVSENRASVEFCVSCAENADQNWKRAGDGRDHSYCKKLMKMQQNNE